VEEKKKKEYAELCKLLSVQQWSTNWSRLWCSACGLDASKQCKASEDEPW